MKWSKRTKIPVGTEGISRDTWAKETHTGPGRFNTPKNPLNLELWRKYTFWDGAEIQGLGCHLGHLHPMSASLEFYLHF